MAYSTCFNHGLNGGINANFAKDLRYSLKRRRGQGYFGLVILVSQN